MGDASRPRPGDVAFLTGGGETGALIREHDWAATPLGPIKAWPRALRSATALLLRSPVPMVMLWGEDGIMLYNDAYSRFAGGRHPHLLGAKVREGWPEVATFNDHVMRVGLAGGTLAYRDQELTLFRHGEPEQVWMNLDYSPVPDEDGRPAGVICILSETTQRLAAERERQRAEARLREGEARFRAAADGSPALMWMTDDQGQIVFANRRYRTFFGVEAEDMLGDGWWRIVHPEDVDAFHRAFDDAFAAREPFHRTVRVIHPELGVRWLSCDGGPREGEGRFLGYAGVNVDVTDAVVAEGALRESEERFRAIVETARDYAIFTTDPEGRIETWPAGAQEVFGWSAAEAIGQPVDMTFTPEDRAIGAPETERLTARTAGQCPNVRWHLRKDGSRVFIDGITRPLQDADGAVTGFVKVGQDVTERQATEDALRASEARLGFLDRLGAETAPLGHADAVLAATTRLLGEHLGVSVCAYADMDEDGDGFTIRGDWAAPGSRSIVGRYRLADFGRLAVANLSAGRPLVVNDNLRELAPNEAATFQGIGIAATICMPLVKDGRLAALMAVHDRVPRNWTEAELGLLREVTARSWAHVERTAAAAALRESEARFRLVADAVPQMVWVTDAEGRVEFFNKQWTTYTGAPFEAITAAEVAANHVHPDDAPATMAAFDEARRTGTTFSIEHRIRSAAGDHRWFLVRGEPHRHPQTGEIVRWFGASVDIHDRRRAEERLRELNETLEQRIAAALAERKVLADIVEGTDALVQVVDPEFRLLAINRASADEIQRIAGLRPRAGDNLLDLLDRRPEEREAARAAWGRALAGEEFTTVGEVGAPGGERRHHEMRYSVLRDAGGRRIGAYRFVYDVTDRVREQAALAEAQEALRQSQKMEAMGQLTGGVAHDFNNLLTPIIASLDTLLRRGLGGERERRLMDGALQSAERARTLVQRLLAFARRQPLQPGPVDVRRLVEGMAGLIASTLGPRIEVRLDLAPDLPPALADANQLEMALLNLAVNARDAMPEGGRLTVAARRESVSGPHAAALRPGHYVRLGVADTGTGMDEATRARAVEPFFSTKGVGRGTGLGLSMVHGLASQLGGGLAIASSPGQGTAVELWLPLSPVAAGDARPAAGAATAAAARARGTALLVDDEDLVRMSTADMLQDLGYEVVEARSAEEALRRVGEGLAPDLVVTDHLMPGLSGVDLARDLLARRPDLPVLIVSGYAEVEDLAPGLPRLVKPFRAAELATSLASLRPGRAQ